jgi:hypothetical protein
MKNSNDTIGSRPRNLPVCSAVPQPLRHRVPRSTSVPVNLKKREKGDVYQIFLEHLTGRDHIEDFRVDSRIGNLTEFYINQICRCGLHSSCPRRETEVGGCKHANQYSGFLTINLFASKACLLLMTVSVV